MPSMTPPPEPEAQIAFDPVDVTGIPARLDDKWQKALAAKLRVALLVLSKSKPELLIMISEKTEAAQEIAEMMDGLCGTCEVMNRVAEAALARLVLSSREAENQAGL